MFTWLKKVFEKRTEVVVQKTAEDLLFNERQAPEQREALIEFLAKCVVENAKEWERLTEK